MVGKEQNILQLIAESHGIKTPDNLLPSERFSMEDIALYVDSVINALLADPYISNQGIADGCDMVWNMLLYAVGSNIDQGQDVNDYLSIPYIGLALEVLRSVEDDLDNNQGKTFRTIIQSLHGKEVALAFGNEDIRDWLIERQKEHPNQELTIYDFEDFETAVAAAVILRIIDTLYDAQQSSSSPN